MSTTDRTYAVHEVYAYLRVHDAARALEFYKRAFGARRAVPPDRAERPNRPCRDQARRHDADAVGQISGDGHRRSAGARRHVVLDPPARRQCRRVDRTRGGSRRDRGAAGGRMLSTASAAAMCATRSVMSGWSDTSWRMCRRRRCSGGDTAFVRRGLKPAVTDTAGLGPSQLHERSNERGCDRKHRDLRRPSRPAVRHRLSDARQPGGCRGRAAGCVAALARAGHVGAAIHGSVVDDHGHAARDRSAARREGAAGRVLGSVAAGAARGNGKSRRPSRTPNLRATCRSPSCICWSGSAKKSAPLSYCTMCSIATMTISRRRWARHRPRADSSCIARANASPPSVAASASTKQLASTC